ncbi:MAG TPA: hypothetical protein VIX90_09545 [Edaphobacter sp.]
MAHLCVPMLAVVVAHKIPFQNDLGLTEVGSDTMWFRVEKQQRSVIVG